MNQNHRDDDRAGRMNAESDDEAFADAADERPSKSQRKREMTALQVLGTRLVKLNADQLARVPISDRLREAIEAARRIDAHEARRRQMQYIGKLMRLEEAAPIERALDDITGDSRASVALMHHCERWRDRLLADDEALTALLKELPSVDVQPLRAMIRAARRERDGGQPPKHARELYRWLHEQLSTAQSGNPSPATE
jgi:ribosome-associated protein